MRIARRGFLGLFGASIASTIAPSLGCSSDSGSPDAGGCGITIATNHPHGPHKLTMTDADVMAAAEKTYDIQGAAAHSHMVTLTADQMAMLKAHGTVMVTSSDGEGHTHMVTVTC
jgi:hypothetical protein